MEEQPATFCIGHHEARRPLPVTSQTIQSAHEANVRPVPSFPRNADTNIISSMI